MSCRDRSSSEAASQFGGRLRKQLTEAFELLSQVSANPSFEVPCRKRGSFFQVKSLTCVNRVPPWDRIESILDIEDGGLVLLANHKPQGRVELDLLQRKLQWRSERYRFVLHGPAPS